MSHLQPPPLDSLPAEVVEELNRAAEFQGFVSRMRQTLALRPRILAAINELTAAVMNDGTVDGSLKSLVALISSVAAGCRHCQAHTAYRAAGLGVDDDKVRDVWTFETSSRFTEAERAALRLARDASIVPSAVVGSHFEELRHWFDDGQIVELLAVVCLFGWNNRWNDAVATATEASPVAYAQAHLDGRWELGKHAEREDDQR